MAFIAYYFHWSLAEIMELQHSDRRGFIEEISAINRRLHEQAEETASSEAPWSLA